MEKARSARVRPPRSDTATLTLNSGFALNSSLFGVSRGDFTNYSDYSYDIAGAGSMIAETADFTNPKVFVVGSGTNPSGITFSASGFTFGDYFTLSGSGSTLTLTFSPVPEPVCVTAILAAGLGGAGWLRRQRQGSLAVAA